MLTIWFLEKNDIDNLKFGREVSKTGKMLFHLKIKNMFS